MRITKLFTEFFESEKSSGVVLITCTLLSLWTANNTFANAYLNFWDYEFQGHSIVHWVNDGLMAIFFLLIGLELVREIKDGELSDLKSALFPVFAALGGMILPALIYFFFNNGTDTAHGFGIPMATDIAFALGVLTLLGSRVPIGLKVFLTALAVIDDLGAILCIALFYSGGIDFVMLGISLGIFLLLLTLNRLKVQTLIPYIIGGVAMWYFMLHSGVHATISGVLLAFTIPFGKGEETTPSYQMQSFLHWPVAFLIMPIFALANTAITIPSTWSNSLMSNSSLGVFGGLVFGKPLGIFLFSFLSVLFGLGKLPEGLKWKQILGVGLLGGIGFTMSIFITMLAFDSEANIVSSKIAILLSSLLAAILGLLFLRYSLPKDGELQQNN